MTDIPLNDESGSHFVRRARELITGSGTREVQFLCDLSRDKVTRNAAEIMQEFSRRLSVPEGVGVAQAVDGQLAHPEAGLDQILAQLKAARPGADVSAESLDPSWDETSQIFGEVPVVGDLEATERSNGQAAQGDLFRELIVAVRLRQLLEERRQNRGTHLKQIRDILSFMSERRPEFVLVVEPLLRIVADQSFAILERGRASRALVNSFNIEQILMFAALSQVFSEAEKQYVFSWLTAYQKLYRRLESVIYDQKAEKVTVAAKWFNATLTALRKTGRAPFDVFELSSFIQGYAQAILHDDRTTALDLGRALVLTTNNEDIIRGLHEFLRNRGGDRPDAGQIKEIYRFIFEVMQDYRMICMEKKKAQLRIKGTFARISHLRRDMERIVSGDPGSRLSTPVLGRRQEHALGEETRVNLERNGLLHLFEIWPLPVNSQKLFNEVCLLKGMIPRDSDHTMGFLLYIEKFLEFLMRLDRLGIRVVRHDTLDDLLTNAYQIHVLHLLKEGMYLGSTGFWRSPNQRPPAVICITNPGAMMNCLNLPMRHINFRIFLGTGQFYESPFILDSTERYGSMDEQGGPEQLFMRPGLFFLDIPAEIEKHWRKVQQVQQRSPHFGTLVQMRAQKG